jgi:predicted Zn-dependent protease with MMP-like domain
MKSHSDQLQEIINNAMRKAASSERERCADLVQRLADGTEDQVINDILNEVVVAIRRLTDER